MAAAALSAGLGRRGDVKGGVEAASGHSDFAFLPYYEHALAQAKTGDKAGAVVSVQLAVNAHIPQWRCLPVVRALVKHDADNEAFQIAKLFAPRPDGVFAEIAKSQAESGRLADAQKTIDLITDASIKPIGQSALASALIKVGRAEDAMKIVRMIPPDTNPLWRMDKIIDAAMAAGDFDTATAIAQIVVHQRYVQRVEDTKRSGRRDGVSQVAWRAETSKDVEDRFDLMMIAGRAHVTAKKENELDAWLQTLKDPADRTAVDLGAVTGSVGIDIDEIPPPVHPERSFHW